MILHRLRLNNFRGVTDREIRLPDQGVVVICGPNEIGKSSMIEALDLLLTFRDRSAHREVKRVKPTNADVGAQIEAEISSGLYRFVYRKRFHKKQMTELDIITPRREHLTGDEAHERVTAMLAETLDTKLWEAQRVLQSAATAAVNLSGSDSLARALDAAAGAAQAASTGTESLLIDRIDSEFERYFTKTAGRPAKEYKAATERLRAADAELQRSRAALAEVDERVARHAELTATVQTLQAAREPAAERLAAAQRAHAVVSAVADQLAQAQWVAKAAAAAEANSTMAQQRRDQLVAEVERRAATLAALGVELLAAEQEEVAAAAVARAAQAEVDQSGGAVEQAEARLAAATAAAAAYATRAEADRLTERLGRIERAEQELAELTAQLDQITLTDALLADIERLGGQAERLQAQLDAEAAVVAFTAPADLRLIVDGQPHTLAAGQQWEQPASLSRTVEVPGVLTVRIDPGESAAKLLSDLDSVQAALGDALARGRVADPAAARDLAAHRRALAAAADQLVATVQAQRDGEDTADLRARLVELIARIPDGLDMDPARADAQRQSAEEGLRETRAEAEVRGRAAGTATAILTERTTRTTLLRDRIRTAEHEVDAVRQELSALRVAVPDDVLSAQAGIDAEERRTADEVVAELTERYAASDPAAAEDELRLASRAAEAVTVDCDAAAMALHNLTVELGVIGEEGRQGRLDEAEAEWDRAHAAHHRIQQRARAAELLRDTMIRHRDNTRQRYVEPYRAELERLGRQVFGSSFEVEVDTELTILTRTLDGCTVAFDSLSGGAREQVGILARLAGAALVAKEDTVPVVIDDALGFTDPDRLVRMGAVLNTVGDQGQVIVLTCTPGRYDGVADAEFIDLSPQPGSDANASTSSNPATRQS